MMSNTPWIITAENLTKRFSDKTAKKDISALHAISTKIEEGKLTALIGPDGAGKTTFMRLICGLLRPTEGTLTVLNTDVAKAPQKVQEQLGYMPQKFGLYEDLSCQENLDLYADLHGISAEARQKRFPALLEMTGLAPFATRLTGKLSGGMKQKLGLVCTLVRSPRLLLLDEPTVGVDPVSRRELWKILQQLVQEERLTVLISTTYMDEAELCQRILLLHHGRILADGKPETLRRMAESRVYTAKTPENTPPRILQAAFLDDTANVTDAVPESGEVRFTVHDQENIAGLKSKKWFPALQVTPVPARLEDSFMILLRDAEEKEKRAEETGMNETKKSSVVDRNATSTEITNDNEETTTPLTETEHSQFKHFALDYTAPVSLSPQIVIEVKDLLRKFGDFTAVDHISFQVHKGEIFGLLGPNGAGKSTTFKMLCGLLPATSGFLSVAGVNLHTALAQARAHVGYVAQKFSLYTTLTVKENLEFFGGAYGLTNSRLRQRLEEVSRQFHLTSVLNTPAGELPGGYKQRLSMAVGLLHQPHILFLDEPTSGIDPVARRTFWRQITSLAAAGTTIIITTHFMEEAEYCDRIMIQDQGKMLILGTPTQVRQQGGNSRTMNQAFIAIVEQHRQTT